LIVTARLFAVEAFTSVGTANKQPEAMIRLKVRSIAMFITVMIKIIYG